MATKTLRIACGTTAAPYSSVWRITADNKKGDVMLSWSKAIADRCKISLHASGRWRYAATSESGYADQIEGDRVFARWHRPQEHLPGVTRGPAIMIPHTKYGAKTHYPIDTSNSVQWFPPPSEGEWVEFSLYFLDKDADPANWGNSKVMGHLKLPDKQSVWVVATVRKDLASDVLELAVQAMENSATQYESLADFAGGSVIITRTSEDDLKTPVFIDTPSLAYTVSPDGSRGPMTALGAPGLGRTLTAPMRITNLQTGVSVSSNATPD